MVQMKFNLIMCLVGVLTEIHPFVLVLNLTFMKIVLKAIDNSNNRG